MYLSTSSVKPSFNGAEEEKNSAEITEKINKNKLVFNTSKNFDQLSATFIPATMKNNVIYAEKIFVVSVKTNKCL